jgi:hypothetical protein
LEKGQQILNTSRPAAEKPSGSSRPADECPYPRPFPAGFSDCPTFLPEPFSPVDSTFRPLPAVLTCRHLVSRSLPNGKFGWYAACEIGDEAARRQMVSKRI